VDYGVCVLGADWPPIPRKPPPNAPRTSTRSGACPLPQCVTNQASNSNIFTIVTARHGFRTVGASDLTFNYQPETARTQFFQVQLDSGTPLTKPWLRDPTTGVG